MTYIVKKICSLAVNILMHMNHYESLHYVKNLCFYAIKNFVIKCYRGWVDRPHVSICGSSWQSKSSTALDSLFNINRMEWMRIFFILLSVHVHEQYQYLLALYLSPRSLFLQFCPYHVLRGCLPSMPAQKLVCFLQQRYRIIGV